mgnify:CR=1 FL=1
MISYNGNVKLYNIFAVRGQLPQLIIFLMPSIKNKRGSLLKFVCIKHWKVRKGYHSPFKSSQNRCQILDFLSKNICHSPYLLLCSLLIMPCKRRDTKGIKNLNASFAFKCMLMGSFLLRIHPHAMVTVTDFGFCF